MINLTVKSETVMDKFRDFLIKSHLHKFDIQMRKQTNLFSTFESRHKHQVMADNSNKLFFVRLGYMYKAC